MRSAQSLGEKNPSVKGKKIWVEVSKEEKEVKVKQEAIL